MAQLQVLKLLDPFPSYHYPTKGGGKFLLFSWHDSPKLDLKQSNYKLLYYHQDVPKLSPLRTTDLVT